MTPGFPTSCQEEQEMLRLTGRPGFKASYTSYLCTFAKFLDLLSLSFLVCKVGICGHLAPKAAVRIQFEGMHECL